MKRAIVILLILAVGLMLLVGCKQTGGGGEQNGDTLYLSLGDGARSVEVIRGEEFLPYEVTGEAVAPFLEALGEISYRERSDVGDEELALLDVEYTIRGSGIIILVCDYDFVICRQDEGNTLCDIVEGDFGFLDALDFELAPRRLSVLAGYTEGDTASVVFYDAARGLTVDLSANEELRELLLTVECDEVATDAETSAKYTLTLGDKVITVNADGSISYANAEGEACRAMPTGDGLLYLDTLFVGEATTLGGYDAEAEIRVYNGQSRYATVSDSAELLGSIGEVELIGLTNAEHYELGKADYTIKIGEESIEIYGNCVKTADGVYAILSGDFDFLGELAFDNYDSGNLPWI